MALDYDVPEDKRALYWLGDKLIEYRNPVMILVLAVTLVFAFLSFQLRLVTSFGDLLPQTHPFVKVHNRYSGTFGGANNIVVMMEVKDGTIFTIDNLTKIFKMTDAMDRIYGVNHNQVESIGHRTVRHLRVAAGGTLRAEPVMLRAPQSQEEVEDIRRIVHNAENIYGLLVSLDDKAALLRANFIEGRLDYKRIFDEVNEKVIAPYEDANTTLYVAGEPRLYGWVYRYAGDVFFILVITYCIEWILRWMYFHDWRGALRPTLTGVIAAFWGLGFIKLIGLALDPLMLVMPFLITARAVSHAIQMHDRYYEEFEKSRLAQAARDRRGVRRALRADLLRRHHRRARCPGDHPGAGDHAAEARDHRVVVDPRDHRLRDAPEPDRLLLLEGAGAGARRPARARRVPQGNRALHASPDVTDRQDRDPGGLGDGGRGRALLHARADDRRPDGGLAAALHELALQRVAHPDPGALRRRRAADRRRRGQGQGRDERSAGAADDGEVPALPRA